MERGFVLPASYPKMAISVDISSYSHLGKASGRDRRQTGKISPVMGIYGIFLTKEKLYAAISLKKPKG